LKGTLSSFLVFLIALLISALIFLIEYYTIDNVIISIILINLIDSLLSTIITFIIDQFILSNDKNILEYNIEKMLVINRLCLSTIFIYFLTNQKDFLNKNHIINMISTQLSVSFSTTIMSSFDFIGMIRRHIYGPLFSHTQNDLDYYYSGTKLSLSVKYSQIAKIMLICLIYSLVVPISLFIGSFAFITLYFIDRYLILRKYRRSVMYNAEIANRFHIQAIGCLAFHMIVTTRLIYSWPMDNIYYHSNSKKYELIDKFAPYDLTSYTIQFWMNNTQKKWLNSYKIITIIIIIIFIYLFILNPVYCILYKIFNTKSTPTATTTSMKSTAIIEGKDNDDNQRPTYSIVQKVLERYIPQIICNLSTDNNNCRVCIRLDGDEDDDPTSKKYLDHTDISYLFSDDNNHNHNNNMLLQMKCLSVVKDYPLESINIEQR